MFIRRFFKMETKQHPLEAVLNLDTSREESFDLTTTTENEDQYLAVPQSEVAPKFENDEEDTVIDEKIEEVYSEAMKAYQNQTAYVEIMEPRYAARNAEVAANYLNTALNAVSLKARVKNEKRKFSAGPGGFVPYKHGGVNNNIVVADRNQLLRLMSEGTGSTIDSDK